MDMEAGGCLQSTRDPQFSQIIMPHMLEDGTLEIPQQFVKGHGSYLPKHACLQVSTGKMWKVELRKCDDRVWLHEGWQEFVENCSIESGHSLVFKYEGGPFFHVFVFDSRHVEIEYPVISASVSQRENLDQSKVESDDDSSVEILDEWPQGHGEVSVTNQSCIGLSASSARGRVIQSARAFESPNRSFSVIMRRAYLSSLYIPGSPARTYFRERNDKRIHLNGPDGRSWPPMGYYISGPPQRQVRINSGWTEFVREYHLENGDTCVFELINSESMTFNVSISRITEQEVDPVEIEMHDILNPTRTESRELSDSTALERAKSLQCSKPSFTVVIKFNTQSLYHLYTLRVPAPHSSTYLSEQHDKQVFLRGIAGKTWPVLCTVHGSVVRLSEGWRDFAVDNDLQEGDACVFELLSEIPPHNYLVTIFHAAESMQPN